MPNLRPQKRIVLDGTEVTVIVQGLTQAEALQRHAVPDAERVADIMGTIATRVLSEDGEVLFHDASRIAGELSTGQIAQLFETILEVSAPKSVRLFRGGEWKAPGDSASPDGEGIRVTAVDAPGPSA